MDLPLGPIILDIDGVELTPEDQELITHPLVGGVIFFKRNYRHPEQMIELVQSIRSVRPSLLLCVDQEGGRVQRFVEGLTKLPRLRQLGSLADEEGILQAQEWSYRLGRLMALEVRSLGIDLSFAPVLDLDRGLSEVIGDRAFHSEPMTVIKLATAYIRGMQSAGMQAVGKHFPGHGAVKLDSHVTLPIDDRSFAAIEEDLLPFKELIREGIPGIMPAHIIFSQIDDRPVGFSEQWLKTILRKQSGFNGTIVSDDLSMAGASIIGDYVSRTEEALMAGCDYLLICNHRAEVKKVLENLTINNSAANHSNRLNLLGKGFFIEWHKLKHAPEWVECVGSALEFTSKTA